LSFIDPLGLWGSVPHESILNTTFATLPPQLTGQIRAGSAYVDRVANQFGDSAEHAMQNTGRDSVAAAKARTCQFITGKIAEYKKNANSSNPKLKNQAYFALGQALHSVMDSTSPEHRGWQVWDPYSKQVVVHGNANGSNEGIGALTPLVMLENIRLINETINGDPCACTK
jgi:hypothetical protein